jgi:hypothetical protein
MTFKIMAEGDLDMGRKCIVNLFNVTASDSPYDLPIYQDSTGEPP